MIRVFLSKYALPTTVATLSIMIFIRVFFFFSENALVDVTLLLCLDRSPLFYYSSGTVLGVLMTLVFVLLMAKRHIPKVGRYLLR